VKLKCLHSIDAAVLQIETERKKSLNAMTKLKAAGMYNAPASESWETRGLSDTRYLFLVFPCNGNSYDGPDGKRRLYVGCDSCKIANARAMNKRRGVWLCYKRHVDQCDEFLQEIKDEAVQLSQLAERYKTAVRQMPLL